MSESGWGICEHVTELTYGVFLLKSAFKTTSEITYLPELTKKDALYKSSYEEASGIRIRDSNAGTLRKGN
jgi:hypothetical protein